VLASTIQNSVVGGGLARTAHLIVTSVSPRYARTELHVILGESDDAFEHKHTQPPFVMSSNLKRCFDPYKSHCIIAACVCFYTLYVMFAALCVINRRC